MSKKNTGFSFCSAILSLLFCERRKSEENGGKERVILFEPSALAHMHGSSRSSGFLSPGVSHHNPITADLSAAAHIACICTVYRGILIVFAR